MCDRARKTEFRNNNREHYRRLARESYARNVDKIRDYKRRYHILNKEKLNAKNRLWNSLNKEYLKFHRLSKKYGKPREYFVNLFESQRKRCAICDSNKPYGNGWHVDHNHDTNEVRAILCHFCNVALGNFKDSRELLVKAISYLDAHATAVIYSD